MFRLFTFLAILLRRAARAGFALACAAGWALAGTAEANLALEPVSLQLRWMHQFQFAGYYAALHKGYYWEAGLDVTAPIRWRTSWPARAISASASPAW